MDTKNASCLFKNGIFLFYLLLLFYGILKRNLWGVDFTDEAAYVAFIRHFVQGAKPFIDEYNPVQGAGFIVYPIYKIYISLKGTDGLVLFSRIFYICLSALVVLFLGNTLKKVLGYKLAILVLINLMLYAFYEIFEPSYYAFLLLALNVTLFLFFYAKELMDQDLKWSHGVLFLSGLSAFLMFMVYPGMIFLVPVLVIILAFNDKNFSSIPYYLGGLFLGILCFLIILFKDRALAAMFYDLKMVRSERVNEASFALSKLLHPVPKLLIHFHQLQVYLYVLLFLILLLGWIHKKTKFLNERRLFILSSLLLSVSIIYLILIHPITVKTPVFVGGLFLFSGGVIRFFLKDTVVRNLFNLIFVPSLIAGICVIWSSDNAYLSSIVGFFPAVLVAIVFWILWSRKILGRNYLIFAVVLTVVINLAFLDMAWLTIFRSPGVSYLTTKVISGPYANLYTTSEDANFIEGLQKDLQPYAYKNFKLFSYNNDPNFSAAYLMDGFKIHSNSVVFAAPAVVYQQSLLNYFKNYGYPDIVVRIQCFPELTIICSKYHTLLDDYFYRHYDVVAKNKNYIIFKKREI